jgi:hypothetical protein
LEEAVSILIQAPKLTVCQAMLAAEFTPEEANNKAMQRKVARTLPGQSILDNQLFIVLRAGIVGISKDSDGG